MTKCRLSIFNSEEMKSHEYHYRPADLLRLVIGPIIPVAVFVAAMQFAPRLNLLPSPRPTLDTDQTILVHQAEASRKSQNAQILLVGDSSCLMDVNARELGQHLGLPSLNLGLLSYLGLEYYAEVLRGYVAANPNRLRIVVLLMHPEALRRVESEEYYGRLLTSYWKGEDACRTSTIEERLACWFGVETFRSRILSRALPSPLEGAFGRKYGFSDDLEAFMRRENGSVIDPVNERPRGLSEYRLSSTLKPVSQQFKMSFPPGVKLLVGITPVPETTAGQNYSELHASMLREWGEWLQADGLLQTLPATLPETRFARPTHLNESAVQIYTRDLATALQPHLR